MRHDLNGSGPVWLDDDERSLEEIRQRVAAHPEAAMRLARDLRQPDGSRVRRARLDERRAGTPGPLRGTPPAAAQVAEVMAIVVSAGFLAVLLAFACGWRW